MPDKRINWIDTVKALGIFLVFYGHYAEVLVRNHHYSVAGLQFKFIYTFHMPMFFMLSGFFMKDIDSMQRFKTTVYQLLLPVLSFGVLSLPFWFFYSDESLSNIRDYALNYLSGNPFLNWMTWFLVCLFAAKLIASVVGVKKSIVTNIVTGLVLVIAGFYILQNIKTVGRYVKIEKNFWFIHEGIIAAGFCFIGQALYQIGNKINPEKKYIFIVSAIVSLALLLLSFNFIQNDVIIMAGGLHTQLLPFILNAILGSVCIISLGVIIPETKLLNFYGANTLILLGINGWLFHFFNTKIAIHTAQYTQNTWASITINCLLYTVVMLIISYPIMYVLNKYVPQLFGKPSADGPIIKALISK